MLRNVKTNEERELPVACVFVAIGHDPNTKAFKGKLETDPDGYLDGETPGREQTSRRLHRRRRGGSRLQASGHRGRGSGCAAAMEAEKYLSALENVRRLSESSEAQRQIPANEAAIARDSCFAKAGRSDCGDKRENLRSHAVLFAAQRRREAVRAREDRVHRKALAG